MEKMENLFQARVPFIDRLVDINPGEIQESRPFRSMDRHKLKQAVHRDLTWLLNTRTPLPASIFDEKELTVIDYGIPDFGSYSPANAEHLALLAKRITRAISAFEPRLQNVHVIVEPEMADEKTLNLIIDAMLIADSVREPVSFMTVLQSKKGTMELRDNGEL